MEEYLLFLVQQGILDGNTQFVFLDPSAPRINLEEQKIRVRQLIPYLLEDMVGIKNSLPPKAFTEKFPTANYPYSVTRRNTYSHFGLELEAMVRKRLSELYGSKFVGKTEDVNLLSLSEKDKATYKSKILESIELIADYFKTSFPPGKIHKVVAEPEFVHSKVSGHPDLVIYLSPKKVAIFDVKVFSLMNVTKSRAIRAQMAMYISLARSQGLECDKIGIVMPWARNPAVCTYDVGKWSSDHLLELADVCAEKVKREPMQQMKWTSLLRQYNVGSHVELKDALGLLESKRALSTPFQIFLYGNNPSPKMEQASKQKWAKIEPGAFSSYNAFVHAPYNLNLASDEKYVPIAAKMYLEHAAKYGFKGVVFHVGHHSSPEIGIAMMETNMRDILKGACPDTPFILETPCGNKNELLSTPEDFGEFVMRFPEALMGICLDTCHVFVADCMPMEYINRLGAASDRICLIHFNGSRKKQGCCADGHGHVTRVQNIPDEELVPVLEKAKAWGICSVTE